MTTRDTFLSYHGFRWLWICAVGLLIFALLYGLSDPIGVPSGGTFLGYTYGIIATALILYLMWFGVRKRSFYAKATTLRGTLAAHVWIGIALIFLVPLHCGFQFGWNVHTLAYALMLAVILSGVWGVVMYVRMPGQILSQRGGGSIPELGEQIQAVSSDVMKVVFGTQASKEMEATQMQAMKSAKFHQLVKDIDFPFQPRLLSCLWGRNPAILDKKRIAELLVQLPKGEQEAGLKVISLVNKKRELVSRIQDEARALVWVRLWLYLHLPLSCAMMVALVVHIISVFYYS